MKSDFWKLRYESTLWSGGLQGCYIQGVMHRILKCDVSVNTLQVEREHWGWDESHKFSEFHTTEIILPISLQILKF